MIDVSILIVHYNTPGLLRQTLKGIRRAAPKCSYEIIVVDNNPKIRVNETLKKEFPEVKVIVCEKNLGFGCGMNKAMDEAKGRYFFIFNPDIVVLPGSIESLVRFMDENTSIGMAGPQLLHPDRSIQSSCYRFMKPSTILYRRIPIFKFFKKAKIQIENYLMAEWDHMSIRDIDYLLGAAMIIRKEAITDVGGFDPNFFVYFEDQDLCRRFWKKNWRVVYYPHAKLIHYHRRETAEGDLFTQILNPLTRIQLKSALYYYKKYKGQNNPRLSYDTHARLSRTA